MPSAGYEITGMDGANPSVRRYPLVRPTGTAPPVCFDIEICREYGGVREIMPKACATLAGQTLACIEGRGDLEDRGSPEATVSVGLRAAPYSVIRTAAVGLYPGKSNAAHLRAKENAALRKGGGRGFYFVTERSTSTI